MKKGLIKATDAFERIVHWSLAVSCLVLCITSLFFILALAFTIRMWWREEMEAAGKLEVYGEEKDKAHGH